jgi:hypothetical protein
LHFLGLKGLALCLEAFALLSCSLLLGCAMLLNETLSKIFWGNKTGERDA